MEESVYEAVPREGCGMGRLGPGCSPGHSFAASVGKCRAIGPWLRTGPPEAELLSVGPGLGSR